MIERKTVVNRGDKSSWEPQSPSPAPAQAQASPKPAPKPELKQASLIPDEREERDERDEVGPEPEPDDDGVAQDDDDTDIFANLGFDTPMSRVGYGDLPMWEPELQEMAGTAFEIVEEIYMDADTDTMTLGDLEGLVMVAATDALEGIDEGKLRELCHEFIRSFIWANMN